MSERLKIGFIGTGNLAGAVIRGLAATEYAAGTHDMEMYLYNRTAAKAEALAAETGAQLCRTLADCVEQADILFLAVKPQNMAELLEQLAPLLNGQPRRHLIVSAAAGIELKTYEAALPGLPVARAMPNTSVAVLAGMTGLMAGTLLTAADRQAVETIFNAVGKTIWIPEADIHAFIAISGSANAYYYYFTEVLAAAGARLGLDAAQAADITRQVAIGAGKMLAEKSESAADLRIAVTSPGGTTAQALASLAETLPEAVFAACAACAKRSEEMAQA